MNSKQMKKVKYLLVTAFTMAIAFVASSCTDGNDWDTDSSKNAYFVPHSITINKQTDGTVNITWETYDKAEGYLIEIASCNGTNFIDPEVGNCKYDGTQIPAGKIIEMVPGITYDMYCEVTDAEAVKNRSFTWPEKLAAGQYQLRMKALASGTKKESVWRFFYSSADKSPYFEVGSSGDEE